MTEQCAAHLLHGLDCLGPLVLGVLPRDLADLEHEVVLFAVLVMNDGLVLDLEAGLVDHALASIVPLCAQDVRLYEVLDHGADEVDHVVGNLVILSPCDTGLGGVRDETPSLLDSKKFSYPG